MEKMRITKLKVKSCGCIDNANEEQEEEEKKDRVKSVSPPLY